MDKLNVLGIIILLIGVIVLILFWPYAEFGYTLFYEGFKDLLRFDFLGGIIDTIIGLLILMPFAFLINIGLFLAMA